MREDGAVPDDSVLDLETRRHIYTHVVDNPGAYLREIQRALDMPMGALEYHLLQLEKAGLITVLHEENKRFFPSRMDAGDKHDLALLRQEALRRVCTLLLELHEASHKALLARTDFAPSTLSFYTAKLVEAGLVTKRKEGRESRYSLTDPTRVHGLLVRYRSSFLDRVLDGFLASFDAVHLAAPEQDE